MAEEQNSIDEFFRQSLGDYREAPPAAAWDDIERKLDEEGKKQPPSGRRYFMRWPWIALVLLLLIGGTWLVNTKFIHKERAEIKAVELPADSVKELTVLPVDTASTVYNDTTRSATIATDQAEAKGFNQDHVGTYAASPRGGRGHHKATAGTRRSKAHSGAVGGSRATGNRSKQQIADQKLNKQTARTGNRAATNNEVANDAARQDVSVSKTSRAGQQRRPIAKRSGRNADNSPMPATEHATTEKIARSSRPKSAFQRSEKAVRAASKSSATATVARQTATNKAGKPENPPGRSKNVPAVNKAPQQETAREDKTTNNQPTAVNNKQTAKKSELPVTAPPPSSRPVPPSPVVTGKEEKPVLTKTEVTKPATENGTNASKPALPEKAITNKKKRKRNEDTDAAPVKKAATVAAMEEKASPKPVADNKVGPEGSSPAAETKGTNKRKQKRAERAAAELAIKAKALAPIDVATAKKLTIDAAGDEDNEDAAVEEESGNERGRGVDRVPSMRQFTLPPVSLSLMAGYEWNLQRPAPDRINTALQFLFHVNESVGIGIQPAYRFGNMTDQRLTQGGAYYRPYAPRVDSFIFFDTIPRITKYTYYINQSYDSITTPSATASGRIWDLTLPVIFHYKAPLSRWHFYGGPSFTFGGKIRNSTVSGTTQTFLRQLRDSLTLTASRPVSSFANHFGLSSLPKYSSYNASELQPGEPAAIRLGYIAGLGYEVRNFLVDLSIQQQLTGYGEVNKALRNVYTSPSFRISIGYRVFSNSASLKGPSGRNFTQRL